MVAEAQELKDGSFKPDGYNVGGTSGQTVMHCHSHLIPHLSRVDPF